MPWVSLFVAGVFEVTWAISLKYADNFTRALPSLIAIVGMLGSVAFLSLSVKSLPLGTAYAVWTGIGAVGTAVCGIILFHESKDFIRVLCLGFIVIGVLGLKFFSKS